MSSHRHKPSSTRIAEGHLASSERGARLLAAAGGDAEHAARIDHVLEDLAVNSAAPRSSSVIQLPARPYDRCDVDESAGLAELELRRPRGFGAAIVLGALAWLVLASVAFGLYSLLSLL